MKVLLINGSPHKNGCTNRALEEVLQTLKKDGIDGEILYLGTAPIADCIACGHCHGSKGCVFQDIVSKVGEHLEEYDGLVVGSPVYYAGPTALVQAFLDRLFYAYGDKLVGKPGAAVLSCRRSGNTASFDRINKYFTINRMPVVSSQYWNNVHGAQNSPAEVEKDEEGLQTMRVLGHEMARFLRLIELGKKEGISFVPEEPHIFTNFHH